MKKRIFSCLILAVVMTFSITCSAFASTNNAENCNSIKESAFTKDTLITKDNIYKILDYYGLDRSALREDIDDKSFGDVTVGNLEDALNEAKRIPKMIVIDKNNPTNEELSSIGITPYEITPMANGILTVAQNSEVFNDGPVVRYTCSGKYYKNGTTKYWTEAAGGADITMVTAQAGTIYYAIDDIIKLETSVENPSTSSSKLVLDYKYDIGNYIGIKGLGGIRIGHNLITGTNKYNTSYIN
ncbi:hypothetical protein [Desulfosporosinus shakirovi]|uniref:hypothetical protein n=1 Tax=Desulfosporosinus shakirovi TaxID=2885154 RepID=UPI001E35C22E|nr:hypothetical protein [Desulfosporosinus sp. SRJS8]MCB8817561.1 hypothetical protein [Desulfosporosinus sp. SRJS8]